MAVKEVDTNQTVNQTQSTSQTATNYQDDTRSNIFSLLRKYETRALGSEGEAFVSKLKQIISEATNNQLKLEYISNVSYVRDANNNVIILLFSKTINRGEPKDILNYKEFRDAVALLNEKMPNVKIANILVIPEQMYQYVSTYADIIVRAMYSLQDPSLGNLSIDSFDRQTIMIDTNQTNVSNVLERLGLPPRCEGYGFLAYLQVKPNENRLLGAVNLRNEFMFQPSMPMVGSGFMTQQSNVRKFTPIVHITDFVPLIPSIKIIPLLLCLADYVVMKQGLWKAYAKDAQKLIIDTDTNKPLEGLSQTELEQFFAIYLTSPIFAVDILEGKNGIPAIAKFFLDQNSNTTEMDEFYHMSMKNKVFKSGYNEIAGIADINGKSIDSRSIDYLWLINNIGYRPEFEKFQAKFNPEMYFNEINKIIPVDPIFVNNVIFVSPQIQTYTDKLLRKTKVISTVMGSANNYIDLSGIISQFGYNPYPMGYTPTGNGYFRM